MDSQIFYPEKYQKRILHLIWRKLYQKNKRGRFQDACQGQQIEIESLYQIVKMSI